MLSTAQMQQMNHLLKEALELDPAARSRWLEANAAQHPELLTALRRALLPQEEGAASAAGRFGTLPGVTTTVRRRLIGHGLRRPGQAIGPYRLIRQLGSGGMGEVWLAQRSDGAFKREVALKLPTAATHRPELASRLEHERDILAALEHPNIARLYDAGITSEGLPYLAMEYVRGEALTAWCDARGLGINQRLRFFLQVLDAVQYAHRRQVMHRDIKPWNILVSDFGQVRLLDFGVAELLGGPEAQGEMTQRFGRALTPEYASPELARGHAIDAAADVYSLGVVLYELLCGNRPYRLEPGTSMMVLESIATTPVEPPSTRLALSAGADRSTTQARLARRLRGDLDAIVLKALAKAPEHRYASPAAFGDDLRRYLSGKPVAARPDRLGYRLSRLVLRHRVVVSVAAASVLLVVTMGYALLREAAPRIAPSGNPGPHGPRTGRPPASTEANNQVLQGNYFLSRHTEADVTKAIGYYQDAIRLDPNYAIAWTRLANAHLVLAGNGWMPPAKAAEQARGELQRALAIDPDFATAHRKLGELYSFFDRDFLKARAQYEQARTLDPNDPKILSSLAVLEASRFGLVDESVALLREAQVHDPLDTSSLAALGFILFCAGRLQEAEAAQRHLLELNPSYTSARAYLALVLVARGRNREALDEAQREADEGFRLFALAVAYWDVGRREDSDRALRRLQEKYAAGSAYNIVQVHAYRGDVDAAFQWLERADRQRDGGIQFLKIDPLLRNLRGDPRFPDLLARLKLAD